MKTLGLILSFIFTSTICLLGQTKIKMEKNGGVYYVPCKINGIPLKFIFDTGATDVSISLTEARFMIKNGFLKEEEIGKPITYQIANGEISEGTRILIRKIEFAGLTLNNVSASIVHEATSPLLLGQSAISKLGKIQLEGDVLTILNTPNSTSYDFSNDGDKTNYIISKNGGDKENPYLDVYKINWEGKVLTFSSAPITDSPSLLAPRLGIVSNNEVDVLERINEKYYRVKSGGVTGYLWSGWFKSPVK